MYFECNDTAYIKGNTGIYDNKIKNQSVRYARNAVNNYKKVYPDNPDDFQKTFCDADCTHQIHKFPPSRFNMQYAPNKTDYPNVMALMGAAFEELGHKISVGVKELTDSIRTAWFNPWERLSLKALDINKDGQIDLGEYSTTLLLEDLESNDSRFGVIDSFGQVGLLPYVYARNHKMAEEEFSYIYNKYNLKDAQDTFLKDPNNMVK